MFALVLALRERGWVQGDEWMQHVAPGNCGPGGAPADTTFESWLRALESLVVARGWGDDATLTALADANRAYHEKFGFVFLYCATGKSAAELLAIAEKRLTADPGEELRTAARELHEITKIRLGKLLEP